MYESTEMCKIECSFPGDYSIARAIVAGLTDSGLKIK